MTIDEAIVSLTERNENLISVAIDHNMYHYGKQQIEPECMRRIFEANELAIEALKLHPQRSKGRWINDQEHYKKLGVSPSISGPHWWWCSECDFGLDNNQLRYANYCPNCGAKMEDAE